MDEIQHTIMKNIGIPKQLRRELRIASIEGERVDDTLNRLLDSIKEPEPSLKGSTNINISEETYRRLQDNKREGETLVKVIKRAVDSTTE